jgi:hypothetical protein
MLSLWDQAVCICVYHKNVKLRLAAIHITVERYYFIDKLVCNVYNKFYKLFFKLFFSKFYIFFSNRTVAMMTRCASCPGTKILRQFLSDLADE